MYEIDTNVDFKASKSSRRSKIMELPFEALKIGDSFHVPTEADAKAQASKLSAWCQLAGKRLSRRFSLRTVTSADPRGPGLRIWRVEDKATSLDSLFAAAEPQAEPVQAKAEKVVRSRRQKATPEAGPALNRRQRKAVEAQAAI